jgi:TonB family protein
MRTLLAVMLAFLPLIQAQDPAVLKSAEPDYDKYNPELATGFDTTIAPVTVTVLSNGSPLSFNSVPLPMAVVMALRDYEFRPQGTVPHGKPAIDGDTYQVTLNLPIRQSKSPIGQSEAGPQDAVSAEVIVAGPNGKPAVKEVQAVRPPLGVAKGLVVKRVAPIYPEAAKQARIQGTVTLEAMVTKQGYVEIRRIINGPFALIEAAYDAVKQWQYRPYLLKGEPVEMITDTDVVFRLN